MVLPPPAGHKKQCKFKALESIFQINATDIPVAHDPLSLHVAPPSGQYMIVVYEVISVKLTISAVQAR